MDPNAARGRGRNVEADVYWRRRFFALAVGLAVLGLLAWASSGAVSGKTPHQAADSDQAGSGNAAAAAYGSAAPGQSAGVAGTPSGQPPAQASIPVSASPTPSATPTRKRTAAGAGHSGTAQPKAGGYVGACPAQDIVLTLPAGKTVYGPGVRPTFQIEIVSTDAAECAFNTGRESLRILITGGSRATWDSGACLRGATAHVEDLRRGVPSVASIVWGRLLRPAGCSVPEVAAPPGEYTVMAASGSSISPEKTFRLR
jgi:hypothetical protein